ncbi:kinetochore-associated protein KNL-2 homolog isoform X1 [Medicago truncatula]|uniref:kinetochore-associated protein KNL-2 homolog isoform X1 n=1 Tax=Medicago truncatula TaxID=3880 RepID=UPI000D2F2304|nr:kinetochore-associated protein KNL-2 homolog isoform X1 [Medicago truncatula]XP_024634939.1 kinetochore-associated protein KNL-2 homolog isoform X1 [Medicago truncatula]XP_039683754.1 kinetochore-associated protein KNL-2 homolog isoform X1 [Medicago truncatula]XP_039683756.1 kinetochore-associated protein KNL-2 homolog isoform X1 [Medicago truncatula]
MADFTPNSSNCTPTTSSSSTSSSSCFQRTVTLYDWWLVKSSQGNNHRLAISGISSTKEEAVRVFNSAPIIKRYDEVSLETVDALYVLIRGFINKQRTLDNGFTPQIFKSFLFGFPQNWESSFLSCVREESETGTDSGNAVLDNEFAFYQGTFSVGKYFDDGEEKSIPTSSVLLEEAPENCKTPFPGDECKVSKKMTGVDIACSSGKNRRSTRLHNIKVCQQKKPKQHPESRGPFKHPDGEPSSTTMAVENHDSDSVVPDDVPANLPEISFDALENSVPTSLVTTDCNMSFLEDEQDMSIKMSEVNNVHGSGRLHNTKDCQKKQPASGDPLKNPEKEQSSTLKVVENHDLDTAVPDNVSTNLPEILSDAVEKSFPTSLVSLDKTTGDRNKAFLEDERDMSIKTGRVNVVHGSGGNKRSARMHNVKPYQKKQPATGDPATHPDKDQISASAVLKMSDGGLESLSTPVQSQKGRVNTMSGQVTNKLSSRISKSFSAKTQGRCKKKRATIETEVVTPKRKIIKHASSVKSPQGRNVSHSNKGSQQRLSTVSPESLSLKKSRSGRWLLPPLEFWRNQQPIYNMDREITEIQEGSSLISPFRGSSSLGR